MSIFDYFKRKAALHQAYETAQWNEMWARWARDEVPSPYRELMRYQGEVNNGGHDQYFCNTENCYDLGAEVEVLLCFLPQPHAGNLQRAYDSYLSCSKLESIPEERAEEIEQTSIACDTVFYENEDQINELLRAYAATIAL